MSADGRGLVSQARVALLWEPLRPAQLSGPSALVVARVNGAAPDILFLKVPEGN